MAAAAGTVEAGTVEAGIGVAETGVAGTVVAPDQCASTLALADGCCMVTVGVTYNIHHIESTIMQKTQKKIQ